MSSFIRLTFGLTMIGVPAIFTRRYRQTILDKLKSAAGLTDIEDRIVLERHLTPQDIHERYRVLNGAIYGLASHGRVMGAFKPGNRSRTVRDLYLAGGAAHPGPGMPMVMMSGWIGRRRHGPGFSRRRQGGESACWLTGSCAPRRYRA